MAEIKLPLPRLSCSPKGNYFENLPNILIDQDLGPPNLGQKFLKSSRKTCWKWQLPQLHCLKRSPRRLEIAVEIKSTQPTKSS